MINVECSDAAQEASSGSTSRARRVNIALFRSVPEFRLFIVGRSYG